MLTINDLLNIEDHEPRIKGLLAAMGHALDVEFCECINDESYLNEFAGLKILRKAPNNNDLNGSSYSRPDDIVCFGYDDADLSDVINSHSVRYYDSFVVRRHQDNDGDGEYSGNQYEGHSMFGAIVVDPPAYTNPIQF
jgi:hypothetical protein